MMTNLPNCFGEWLKDPGAKTIGALHLAKKAAEPLSAIRCTEAPFGEMPQTMSFTDVLGAGAAIG